MRWCACAQAHHSSFWKPEAEHLAAHVFSHLPCTRTGGDWTMNATHRVRSESFTDENMVPVLAHGSADAHAAAAATLSDVHMHLQQ